MSREWTGQSRKVRIIDTDPAFEIRHQGLTVWVTLLGIVDKPRMKRLIGRVAPLLGQRGFRIVLEGSSLCHLDYRAVRPLLDWNRSLAFFGHALMLKGWSNYLKTILCMEDWDRELGVEASRLPVWRSSSELAAGRRP